METPEEEEGDQDTDDFVASGLVLKKYVVEWKEDGMPFDQRTQAKWTEEDPEVRWQRISEVCPELLETKFLKYLCVFFPVAILPWWCAEITERGREKYEYFLNGDRDFTPGLFFVFLGDFLYMATNPGQPRAAYFQDKAEFPRTPHNLERFGLKLHEFEHILAVLELPIYTPGRPFDPDDVFNQKCGPPPNTPSPDVTGKVRRLVDLFNAWVQRVYIPSHILNPDESMVRWLSKYGVPAFMFVPRKPDPVGNELKSVADAVSKVMVYLDLQEGKAQDSLKTYYKEYGATTAFILRMIDVMKLRGKGKVIVADSWFGSVKAAILVAETGNFLLSLVKTNSAAYPIGELRELAQHIDKSTHSTRAVTLVASVKLDIGTRTLIACYHKGPADSILPIISTCGTTVPGPDRGYDAHKKLSNGEREIERRVCKQPEVAAIYRKFFHIIDNINQQCSQTQRLDDAWKTHYWAHRFFSKMLAIMKVSGENLWKHFCVGMPEFVNLSDAEMKETWTRGILWECFHNPFLAKEWGNAPPTPQTTLALVSATAPVTGASAPPEGSGGASQSTGLQVSGEQATAHVCFLKPVPGGHAQKCTVPTCKKQCYSMCGACHNTDEKRFAWICGAKTKRDCFQRHVHRVVTSSKNFTPQRKRKAKLIADSERRQRLTAAVETAQEEADAAVRKACAAAAALAALCAEP
ncbi:hypothetical protein CYMTET_20544 [Cymbomonas tetramitiformis]|uniref:PiggyBac transposable element-derived protein domain-containing protein n=1 Tax=Cymbomonas tetramitiformis TaxID=36881 RepID=A0AAE0G3T0_9CHLO|nr:hypothetical protein CYMTET_42752 [Cymbomonas tetramitiformis]KAK3249896.1 hypothetical protein CYMTET_40694 [Cymbomonas tetramitiformis]KAK3271090.1 hypothetical protein CYMTET_20544 [Cymbomonas tetramitiformis]